MNVVLHAAKSWDANAVEFLSRFGIEAPRKSPDSYLWAVCKIRKFVKVITDLEPDQQRWFFGPYGWVITDFVPLVRQVTCKGALGFWKFDSKPETFAQLCDVYQQSIAALRER